MLRHIDKDAKIYIAGHQGLVGSALVRALTRNGFEHLIMRTMQELDLRNQQAVNEFFIDKKPDYVFLAAAKVGGIQANYMYPADFIYDNLMIAANVIHASYLSRVTKLLYLGSSCIYPRECAQPIKEEYLLTGPLEPTNEAYALAKIAGLKMCESYNKQFGTRFISAMPTNLYGPYDTFDIQNSHVIPALIKKFHQAKLDKQTKVVLWGSGSARREFLFVDDLAQALIMLMNNYEEDRWINVGTGVDVTIAQLGQVIKKVIGFEGELVFDTTKPDGTLQKLLDVARINALGWYATTMLEDGIKQTYDWFLDNMIHKISEKSALAHSNNYSVKQST